MGSWGNSLWWISCFCKNWKTENSHSVHVRDPGKVRWGHSKPVAVYKPGREFSPGNKSVSTLILEFHPPELWEINAHCLSQSNGIFYSDPSKLKYLSKKLTHFSCFKNFSTTCPVIWMLGSVKINLVMWNVSCWNLYALLVFGLIISWIFFFFYSYFSLVYQQVDIQSWKNNFCLLEKYLSPGR